MSTPTEAEKTAGQQFRRKPTIIEAEQWQGNVTGPLPKGVCIRQCLDAGWMHPHVHTMHDNQANGANGHQLQLASKEEAK